MAHCDDTLPEPIIKSDLGAELSVVVEDASELPLTKAAVEGVSRIHEERVCATSLGVPQSL